MKYKHILRYILILVVLLYPLNNVFAQSSPPQSSNYTLLDYGFGSGGTASSSSSLYSLFGTLGQIDQGSPSSENYFIGAGLEYTITASTPAAPTFTNPSGWYNKLKIVINRGGADPTDYRYAIAIASGSGNFQYVQNDSTVGDDLGLEDWQFYSQWGGASGFNVIGLYPGTTYTVKVTAKQGDFFTQSFWSPLAFASTTNPTLSFDLDVAPTDQSTSPPYTVSLGNLAAGSVVTSTDKIWVSIDTNSANGGLVYVSDDNYGLFSTTVATRITSATTDLAGAQTGYGARSNSVGETSGGPMRAISPYDGASDNVGMLDPVRRLIFDSTNAPVTGGRTSFEIKAKASTTTPGASDYADVITVLATGSF